MCRVKVIHSTYSDQHEQRIQEFLDTLEDYQFVEHSTAAYSDTGLVTTVIYIEVDFDDD